MVKAELADAAKRLDDKERARSLLRQALVFERYAAETTYVEPSRSVLFRSAATIAVQLGDYIEAWRLVQEGLAGDPPAEIRDELLELQNDIETHRP